VPRNRIIKHAIFTNEKVKACSFEARWLFAGLWCFADCQGVIPAVPARIKSQVLPDEGFSNHDILGLLRQLADAGLICPFTSNGDKYFWITGFHEHQKLDHPSHLFPAVPREIITAWQKEPDLFPAEAAETREPSRALAPNKKEKEKKNEKKKESPLCPPRGAPVEKYTRWPDDREVPEEWIEDGEAHLAKHAVNGVNVKLQASLFANHWVNAKGKGAQKRLWHRAWLNWCLGASNFDRGMKQKPKLVFK
jgi:hypothetical protein